MNRREFLLTSLAGVLAGPRGAGAQQPRKVYRVGYLGNFPPTAAISPPLTAFVTALREHGYVEGVNLKLEYRWALGRSDTLQPLVRELLEAGVDVVVTSTTPAALTLKEHAKDVPVVVVGIGDPVESGLVQSLARPGGRVTGISSQLGDLAAKALQLCRELVPGMSRLAVFWTPSNQGSALGLKRLQSEAAQARVAIIPVSGETRDEIESALSILERERPHVVMVHASYVQSPEASRIAAFTLRHRIPTLGSLSRQAHDGLLMSYSPDFVGMFRRAAYHVDRILRGTRPADLPVEQPTNFELVINLNTAKALGLTIPPSLLARADQVIQ